VNTRLYDIFNMLDIPSGLGTTYCMLSIFLIITAIIIRLLPHPANFTPLGAMALFGGAKLNKKLAILLPFIALAISDYLLLYINPYQNDFSRIHPISAMFHSTTLFVWGSFLISVLMGYFLRNTTSYRMIAIFTLISSIQFFLITNFGVWAAGYYPQNFGGLMESYAMALPFFRNSILGDMIYTLGFFALFDFAKKRIPKLAS
jgi:hypothetical protein